jgi:hypothetical protein
MLARSTTARIAGRSLTRSLAQATSSQAAATTSSSRMMMSTKDNAPTSFSHEKMEADARYKVTVDVPESLMQAAPEASPFSIQGKFREGRAAYLDMSATTPLDPRVLDAMAPYMVSTVDNLCHDTRRIIR